MSSAIHLNTFLDNLAILMSGVLRAFGVLIGVSIDIMKKFPMCGNYMFYSRNDVLLELSSLDLCCTKIANDVAYIYVTRRHGDGT